MKKRVLILLLCVAMLLSTVALLASCGGEEPGPSPDPDEAPADPIEVSETKASVDFSGYKLVRPSSNSYTNVLKQSATDLSQAITAATRQTIRISDDNGAVSTDDKEILLGFGERDIAGQALSELSGNGWIIRTYADQGKIVIAGTTEFLTSVAIEYFIDNCLQTKDITGSVLSISDKIVCQNIEMVDIVGLNEAGDEYEGKYCVVYNDRLDDDPKNAYGDAPHTTNFDKPYEVAKEIKEQLVKKTSVKGYTIPYKLDSAPADDKATAGKKEILVGVLKNDIAKAEQAKLKGNQYSLVVREGTIVLGGNSDTMLLQSKVAFWNMIEQSIQITADGDKYITIPANYRRVYTDETSNKIVDFPQPDNVDLAETADVGSESLLHIYTGDGASREGFEAYCAKLESEGYEVISKEYQAEGSSFCTFLNNKEKITLHVSHQAHAHAADQKVDAHFNALRVVSASTKTVDLDPELFNEDRTWVKKTDSMITNYELHRSVGVWGNSYVMTLEDGSFFIYDGGYNGDSNVGKDEHYLYEILLDLYKKINNGKTPDANNPIRISAWFMSHEHGDHFGVMKLFFRTYGKSPEIKIERVLSNMISAEERVNSYNPETQIQNGMEDLKTYARGCDFIKVHTGETYYFANAAVRVLYTHEDLYPVRLGYFNNSSTVFRIEFGSTDVTIGGQASSANIRNTESTIWLGDLERNGSKCLRSMWGTAMKADMVQVAHHGYNGCEEKLYKLIQPEVVWFPANNKEVMNHAQDSRAHSSNWSYQANYAVCREMDNLVMLVTGGDCNTNNLGYNLTLTLTVNGPDYEHLYDAINHKVVVPETEIPQPGQGDCYVVYLGKK